MDLYSIMGNLKDIGFYDILLPWALFFAIVYGLLISFGPFKTKSDTEGEEGVDKTIPAIIAASLAFFAIAFTPYGLMFGVYLAELFGKAGTVLAGLLLLVLFLGMAKMELPEWLGATEEGKTKGKTYGIFAIVVAAVIYFTTGFDRYINIYSPTFATDTIVTLIVLAILGGAIYLMMKKKE